QIIGENLVEMERLHVGQAAIHCKRVRVRQVLDSAVAVVAPLTMTHEVAVDVACEVDIYAWADSNRLRQVVTNLLSNAIRHSPRGSVVRVECRSGSAPDTMTIAVSDSGPGVVAERRAN